MGEMWEESSVLFKQSK